jgi:FlgD Ig-like domain
LQRVLSTALVLGLLVATAAAFAVTEGLKLTKSPITRTQLPVRVFSPVCSCRTDRALLHFSLRHTDTITLDVVTPGGKQVRRIADAVPAPAGANAYSWNGRTDAGGSAPDGTYQFRVHLAKARRTILLPNTVVLDTTPPRVLAATPNRATFSPDGDGQSDQVKVAYRLSEPGHAALYLNRSRLVFTRFARQEGKLTWNGRAGGRTLPQGTYTVAVGAQDRAGNVTPPAARKLVPLEIRYLELARHSLTVKAGARFGVGVTTDAASYSWRLGSAHGVSGAKKLVVRAPRQAGAYRLVVTENGHADVATVRVRPRS